MKELKSKAAQIIKDLRNMTSTSNINNEAANLIESLIQKIENPDEIQVTLPNGDVMRAKAFQDDVNPAIDIYLGEDNEKILCFGEYNMDKPCGERVCVCAYKESQEDSVYYDSYNK